MMKKQNIELTPVIEENKNEKVKTKSIESKNNSKIEQYTRLKDVLNEIIKQNDSINMEENYGKTKK